MENPTNGEGNGAGPDEKKKGHRPSEAIRKNWTSGKSGGVAVIAVAIAEVLAERPEGWSNTELRELIGPMWKEQGLPKKRRPGQQLQCVWTKVKALLTLEQGAGFCFQDAEDRELYWYGIAQTSEDVAGIFATLWSAMVSRVFTLEKTALHLLKTQPMTDAHRQICINACRTAAFIREELVQEVERLSDELVEGCLKRGRRLLLSADEEETLGAIGKLPKLSAAIKKQLFLGPPNHKDKGED